MRRLRGLRVRSEGASIQLSATHINQRQIHHVLWRKGLFTWRKLIVLPRHCSSSKTVLQSTKDVELELKWSTMLGLAWSAGCWADILRTGNPSQVISVNLFGKHTDEVFGLTHTRTIWTSVKCTVSCAAHLPSKGNGSSVTSIQTTPPPPPSSSPKLAQQTHGALQTVLFMKEVMMPHMVGALKYTRLLPRLLKMYCGRLYIRE